PIQLRNMTSIRSYSFIVLFALLHFSSEKVIGIPKPDLDDQESLYIPRNHQPNALGSLMRMAYNHSIPVEALRACELELGIACSSPSPDGTHKCITPVDVCDHEPHCPRGEDETPVICFFYKMHFVEQDRLRNHAIALYREMSHHTPRAHGH
ncbi:hypothetical protein PENTCL1PPCAC_29229, partial [Pristionchus entomophagus]